MADEAERLYALPLEEFTAERDAAAKALRRGGDREAAAELAKLPKPTPAAWAANQVAREHPDVLEAFLSAGAALREAQEAALAGEGGALRDATRAQRRAVDAYVAAAQPLRPSGRPLSRTMTDRLRTTLLAAAGNEELSSALAEARLALEAEAGGAWPPPDAADAAAAPARPRKAAKADGAGGKASDAGGAASARADRESAGRAGGKAASRAGERSAGGRAPARKPAARAAEDAAARERAAAEKRERAEAERAEREAAKRAREALERELREARGASKVRERALTAAEKDAHRAARRLEHALAEAEDARVEAEAMEKVVGEARAALDGTRDQVARLEERLD